MIPVSGAIVRGPTRELASFRRQAGFEYHTQVKFTLNIPLKHLTGCRHQPNTGPMVLVKCMLVGNLLFGVKIVGVLCIKYSDVCHKY